MDRRSQGMPACEQEWWRLLAWHGGRRPLHLPRSPAGCKALRGSQRNPLSHSAPQNRPTVPDAAHVSAPT